MFRLLVAIGLFLTLSSCRKDLINKKGVVRAEIGSSVFEENKATCRWGRKSDRNLTIRAEAGSMSVNLSILDFNGSPGLYAIDQLKIKAELIDRSVSGDLDPAVSGSIRIVDSKNISTYIPNVYTSGWDLSSQYLVAGVFEFRTKRNVSVTNGIIITVFTE
jgi:hypothetical protein